MKDIKDYRDKELRYLLIANSILFLFCTNYVGQLKSFSLDRDYIKFIADIVGTTLISGVLSLIAYLFDSIYSSDLKDILLGFGLIKKPGYTIFTRISDNKLKDDRFTNAQVKEKYQTILQGLPSNKKEKQKYENSVWYFIYSKYRDSTMILVSQRDFLLCRDLYISTITFLTLYLIGILAGLASFSIEFLLYLIILSVVLNIAAHTKASKFVTNVIAIDIATKESEVKTNVR